MLRCSLRAATSSTGRKSVMAHVVTGELYFQIDGQLHEIKRQLRQESGYPYSPYQLKTALQAAIEGNFANVDTYHVTINYKGSVEEMVKRGKYDWSNCEITSEYFPSDQDGDAEVCIELIRFERTMGSSEVLEELDSRGLRPASLRE